MQISILLFKEILSFFLMMFMGFCLVKAGLIQNEGVKGFATISMYIIAPCVIIDAYGVEYTEDTVRNLLLALVAAVVIQIILLFLGHVLGRACKLDGVEKTSVIYSNAGMLIIPIVLALLGKEWVIYCTAYMTAQTVLFWTHCRFLLSGIQKPDVKEILCNVNIISLIIGLFLFITKTELPAILKNTFSSVGTMFGPCGMLLTGMLIANVDWKKTFLNRRIYAMAFLRLIAFPAIMLVLLKYSGMKNLTPEGSSVLLITFLAAAAPSASTVTQMSQAFGRNAEYASAINVLTTLCCIITMPVMVYFYLL